ncbi:hypothetical protein HPB50_020808 [Hyalomma asiaticum]|uniref:Uncharacterized protein n=1 Tax=Hyalomma asiaticum TaxID=266040 RepID=A0ACB7T0S1_HYAAI|nr:hypothetical protein HPB50_020808 [Hyalomma asiaticum]
MHRTSALVQMHTEEETIRFLAVVLAVTGAVFVLVLVAVVFDFSNFAMVCVMERHSASPNATHSGVELAHDPSGSEMEYQMSGVDLPAAEFNQEEWSEVLNA